MEITEYRPGTFSWAELTTTDDEAAKRFYTGLFGWTADEIPLGDMPPYVMLNLRGKRAAALFEMTPEMQHQGIPTHWMSYVTVESVDDSAEKVTKLGGKVMQGPMDVFEEGRTAMVQDREGAMLALWQPKNNIGAQVVNEPGAFSWNELYTNSPQTAIEFYTGLFGWTTTKEAGATGEDYTLFHNGDSPAGGMLQIQPEWGSMPPSWAVYFAVEGCDAAVEKAQGLGGKVAVPAMDMGQSMRFAGIEDPQGAFFMVVEMREGAM